jgi:hypothetical protein
LLPSVAPLLEAANSVCSTSFWSPIASAVPAGTVAGQNPPAMPVRVAIAAAKPPTSASAARRVTPAAIRKAASAVDLVMRKKISYLTEVI